MNYKFKIFEVRGEDKLMVASGESSNRMDLESDCKHYAAQYSQDGPIDIWRNYDDDEITLEEIDYYLSIANGCKATIEEKEKLILDFIEGKVIKGKDIDISNKIQGELNPSD